MRPLFKLLSVKSVQRLTVFQHHVVRDIYDVVDRADASRHQTVLHPQRRRADRTPSIRRAA